MGWGSVPDLPRRATPEQGHPPEAQDWAHIGLRRGPDGSFGRNQQQIDGRCSDCYRWRVRIAILGSGSKGNCVVVDGGGTTILIDVGFGPKEVRRRMQHLGMDLADIDAIIITLSSEFLIIITIIVIIVVSLF